MKKTIIYTAFLFWLMPAITSAQENESAWNTTLKAHYFAGKGIDENNRIISLEAPYRAEDPALVPLKITSKIAQTPSRYIKRILVLVDNNPFPFVGEFEFTPESGKADLAMRVRVNTYSYIRAIAEMNDGSLSMSKQFVKASGGCSAPIGADLDAAMKRLGKMKFRLDNHIQPGKPTMAQLLISHPNITGMQMDQVTRFVKKSHFVDRLTVKFNQKPVLIAKTDIAISSDPNFRFYFIPQQTGTLTAEFTDISCELPTRRDQCQTMNQYSHSEKVGF